MASRRIDVLIMLTLYPVYVVPIFAIGIAVNILIGQVLGSGNLTSFPIGLLISKSPTHNSFLIFETSALHIIFCLGSLKLLP